MALSPDNNWVEVLQNFPSYKEYEKLDNVDFANEKGNLCNGAGSINDIQKLKNSCYYFQHWFFDNIAKKYYNGNHIYYNHRVAQKLFNIVSTLTSVSSKINQCYCHFSGSPDDWKKEKYLHDYFENHKYISCSNSSKDRCEEYIQYVTYINSLFPRKEDKCCDEGVLIEEEFCESYFKCDGI
ncbi:CYIR protein [Plasmodium cynomolgi strain B]|uniref:CYIR protein n=1 Tax=Plasmodium cynomolgi (strain B) TaxID=1120755 RepID=K6UZW3_PLACD|nr:CYIR protein [Plasmodium cynomolgi strain B]GAB69529.1 CYIR protein [Plasmodium cynomolgi strain B]